MSKPDAVHAVHKAGYAVTFDKFQFITINGAGHMVRDIYLSSFLSICFMTHLSFTGSSIPTCFRGNHVSQVLERREVLNTRSSSAVLYKVKEYETINRHHCLQVT